MRWHRQTPVQGQAPFGVGRAAGRQDQRQCELLQRSTLAEAIGGSAPTICSRWPMLDAATHSVQVRLDLPARTGADASALAPGLFARAWLPGATAGQARLSVPASAVVRRAEMTGLYVVGADGVALLRQVRLGAVSADKVEVLSGVSAGEQVALDPQKAARLH